MGPRLRELLDTDCVLAYTLRTEESRVSLDEFHTFSGLFATDEARHQFAPMVERQRWSMFDPSRPAPSQRNVVIDLGILAASLDAAPPRALRATRAEIERGRTAIQAVLDGGRLPRWAFGTQHQMRALLCSGESLLAWVGGFQAEPFTAEQRATLAALVPSLRRRLALERLTDDAALTSAALGAALEAVPAAALVVSPGGHVRYANAAGRQWLALEGAEARRAICESLRGVPGAPLQLTPILAPGCPPHLLAVARNSDTTILQLHAASQRWSLTPRQAEVLRLLAQGKANKTIAVELGLSLATVEFHVTALLAKAECDSRSSLIARVWSLGPDGGGPARS